MASRIGAHDVVATRRIEFTTVGPDGWRRRDPAPLYVYILHGDSAAVAYCEFERAR